TFYVAGRMGSALFHPEDPFAVERPLDDKRFALDHFSTKLFTLPDLMHTPLGRMLADQRVGTLRRFLSDLETEISV
ncbi:MAG: hydrolase, partial [Magnetococcales bacterium]|nr:hydrolase [Magnetococcales bacterium]